jgi:hypothetical protein
MEKNNTQEEWKAIAECNGEYYISNHGRVKSYKFGKERILKPQTNASGYQIISICTNSLTRTKLIHQFVALAFIENLDNKPQVNHCDGDKTNNHADNLQWVTHRENVQHGWDTGLFDDKRKKISASAILHRSKPVIDLITGTKYKSLSDACRVNNLKYSTEAMRIRMSYKTIRFMYL